ncbi:MAG: hypothetical protein LBQ27_05550 [Clostridiales bacterium]|jgi:hypothetical protein|nr:hypothetical protein [Clostridiales bacterium]
MWFESLHTTEQVLFAIATAASALLVIQLILLILGLGNDSDAFDGGDASDADIPSNSTSPIELGGLKIFTIRGIIAFFAAGGWVAFGTFDGLSYWSFALGAAAGAAVTVALAFLMNAVMKLEKSGNILYDKAIGATGTVYLNIPPKRSGTGKITVMIQQHLAECEAVTDDTEKIETGAVIKVTAMIDANTFLVERIK